MATPVMSRELVALAREIAAAGGADSPAGRGLAYRLCVEFSIERLARLDNEAASHVLAAVSAILLASELVTAPPDVKTLLAHMNENPAFPIIEVAPWLMRRVIEEQGRSPPNLKVVTGGKT